MNASHSSPRTSLVAVTGFVLGLLAVVPFVLIVAGVPALVISFIALRQINESDGRLQGVRLAIAGMVLGAAGMLASLFGVGAMLLLNLGTAAHRVSCQNHLRHIGFAVNFCHDEHGAYPAATIAHPELPPERRLSWLAAVLPYLEREPGVKGKWREPRPGAPSLMAYEQLDLARGWDDPKNRAAVRIVLPTYHCPANPHRSARGDPALTHYVGIAGIGADAAALPIDDVKAGFFGYERRLTRKYLQDGRGDGKTLVAAETSFENGPWAAGGWATVRVLDPMRRPHSGAGRPLGGLHPHGLFVLFADATVQFLRDHPEPATLERLAAINPPKE